MIWVVEPDVFDASYAERMATATRAAGHRLLVWDDHWWDAGLPALEGPVVFHGSLGNADALGARAPGWSPGVFCATDAFRCSAWYPRAARWLLHTRHIVLPAKTLVAAPDRAFEQVGAGERAFLRPDSPLKPFAGRVLAREAVTLAALDHGFYYDEDDLPVVVAPVRTVGQEWRFVVVENDVVAGSGYLAEGRRAVGIPPESAAWRFAAEVAAALVPPEPVYVLDVCETPEGLHLLELNPFSGADLYACDLDAVVAAVGGWATAESSSS